MSHFTGLVSSLLNARRNVSRPSLVRVLGGESQMPWFQNSHAQMSGSEDRGNIVPSFLPGRFAQGFAPFLLVSSFPDFQTCSSGCQLCELPSSFLP